MHLSILMCNTDRSEFAEKHPTDGEKFTSMIHSTRPDWQCSTVNIIDGEIPDLTAYDGHIITGSPASIHDDYDWIPTLLSTIRDAAKIRIPVFGACFGHQAIAKALATKIITNPCGWVLGTVQTSTTQNAPIFFQSHSQMALYAAHKEQVAELPNGAQLTQTTSGCPIAGFSVGNHILTTQYHPEMTPHFIDALTEEIRDTIGEDVYQQAKLSLQVPADSLGIAELITRFFENAVDHRQKLNT